ncbi:hypothetical protein L9W97_15745 [Vibrio aestuarianus]|uniref:hypothetical protein n=1 Tax=Vibrio aestuarianus TaxID=28171 RepID=UPI00237C581E|nr:hypothetical protein [Vibrio aestuarianus]MDE1326591.1 hypothetical protein [Vibrio aestuarianus]
MKKNIKYLDLSGYMFSGKSAFSDLMREFDGYLVPDYRTEFDLVRVSGGLLDLRGCIVDNWSPIRADASVKKFKKTINVLSRTPKGFRKLYQSGFGYEKIYPNIDLATSKFISELICDSWRMKWPYALVDLDGFAIFKTKLKAKLEKKFAWPEVEFNLISGHEFDKKAQAYIKELLCYKLPSNVDTVVTHNALEPYNPELGIDLFGVAKSIVIDRDVRDIYMTSITLNPGYNDDVDTFKKISGSFNIDSFIKRQKLLRQIKPNKRETRVLRINFEDLVYKYDDTISEIINFLEIDQSKHVLKGMYFNPEASKKNTKLWLNCDKKVRAEISKIERELSDYCYFNKV